MSERGIMGDDRRQADGCALSFLSTYLEGPWPEDGEDVVVGRHGLAQRLQVVGSERELAELQVHLCGGGTPNRTTAVSDRQET